MSEKIEKLFKNALEQASVEPPARVWEGINSHFVMKQKRLRRIYTYSGIAAAVILLFGVGFFMQTCEFLYPYTCCHSKHRYEQSG